MSRAPNDFHPGNRNYPDPPTDVDRPTFAPDDPIWLYRNDARFHRLVDELGVLLRTWLTPLRLQEAVNLATRKHYEYDNRPIPKCSTSPMPGDKPNPEKNLLDLIAETLKGATLVTIADITPRDEIALNGWHADRPCGPKQVSITATWPTEPIVKKSAPTVIPETPKPAEVNPAPGSPDSSMSCFTCPKCKMPLLLFSEAYYYFGCSNNHHWTVGPV